MRARRRIPSIAALVVALAAAPAWAVPSKSTPGYDSYDDTYGDDYQIADIARVTHVEGGLEIVRAYGDGASGPEQGERNDPVLAGDVLRTGDGERAEVQLADGSLVRIDRATEVRMQAMPDPYAEFRDNTVLALTAGSIQVVSRVREEETFRVDTTGATVHLLGPGEFRIDVAGDGRTRVASRQGVAEVAADRGSVLVRAGQRTEALAGAYPAEPETFNTLDLDRFDRWTKERDREWLAAARPTTGSAPGDDAVYEELPPEVRPHYDELSRNGRWVWVEDYGWSWYPVTVEAGWRPYVYGSWWYGPYGYFWCGNEPWGWAPYHYGRWSYAPVYGWVWTPGRVFAGAWVSWSWGSAYVGWCPLGYWNVPVAYGPRYWGGYYTNCWTFVSYTHITARNYHRYAVPVDRIGGDLDGRVVSTRPPRVAPRDLRADASARAEAVRQVRDGRRPALDRGLADGADRRASSRERFREIEDRLVQRGARERRVREVAERRDSGRSARGSDRIARPGRPGEDAAAIATPRARPRQIRGEDGRGDERVRDLYRRVGGADASTSPPVRSPVVRERPTPGSRTEDGARSDRGRSPGASRVTPPSRDRRVQPPTSPRSPGASSPGGRDGRRDAVRPAPPGGERPPRQDVRRPAPPSRRPPAAGRPGGSSAPTKRVSPPSRSGDSGGRSVRPASPSRPSPRSSGASRAPSRPKPSGASRAPSRPPAAPKAAPRGSGGGPSKPTGANRGNNGRSRKKD